MATIKWALSTNVGRTAVNSVITILDTGLNSLAASTGAALSAAVLNSSNSEFDLLGDFELNVTFAVAPTADTLVKLYIVRALDPTGTYEDGSTATIFPKNGYVGAFQVRNVTANRMILPEVSIPPTNFKCLLVNEANQAFSASGNTLKALLYKYQSVG